jgi:predicted transcriptional regulator
MENPGSLRKEIWDLGLTMTAFARASGLSTTSLYRIDADPSQVRKSTVSKVRQTLARLKKEMASAPLLPVARAASARKAG